jgi:hypothetical protein
MPDYIGTRRRSAVLRTHAPGAIVDMRSERGARGPVSGVCAGLESWVRGIGEPPMEQRIVERRLCKKLGKRYFLLPPVYVKEQQAANARPPIDALVVNRFPRWLQCPKCQRVKLDRRWGEEAGDASRYCAECTMTADGNAKVCVVPVRFAAACTNAHLEDFPWFWWVHRDQQCIGAAHPPEVFELAQRGAGLAGLILSCVRCKRERSMDGVFGANALAGLHCRGMRPWLGVDDPEACECNGGNGQFRVVQRGASNLHYPVTESALDIPPWTKVLEASLGPLYADLEAVDSEQLVQYIGIAPPLRALCGQHGLTPQQLADAFNGMRRQLNGVHADSDLRDEEYRLLSVTVGDHDPEFQTRVEEVPAKFKAHLQRVVRLPRLREVRAVRGFTRIRPPEGVGRAIAPLSKSSLPWLPGIELRGEGIFIQLNDAALERWETQPNVVARAQNVRQLLEAYWHDTNPAVVPPVIAGPRTLMVHALSHALMRQLILECGYSSASLQERLYVWEGDQRVPERGKMAGLLIYTSTSDSDGTLGGLQRRANQDLLSGTILSALRSMRWCSSDPLCVSGSLASPESYSIASCHNCMLVPETACEHHNKYLDRALLVGTDQDRTLGFFSSVLDDVGGG